MKLKIDKKMTLRRETLQELGSQEARQVAGGITSRCTSDPNYTCGDTCLCQTSRYC